jgi:archaellin
LVQSTSNSRNIYAVHLGTSSHIWGIQANAISPSNIHEFDPSTDTTTTISRIPTSNIENGRGMASDGTNLWYTIVGNSFQGDGKIHKIAPAGGPDLATLPDPFGPNGRGIGALDFDGKYLWAISYLPSGNNTETIFKIDINTGTVLASCDVPYIDGGGVGADTLAIVNGKILTDAGELLTKLIEYNPPTGIGGSCTSTGNVFALPVRVTGVDTDDMGNLLVTNLRTLYNLGTAPYNTIVASQPSAFPAEEDITTKPALDVPTSVCPDKNVQHWDKILFMIRDPEIAMMANVSAQTELDIKVLDDPHKVADVKQKVLDFLKLPVSAKRAIQILDVNYAIICSLPQLTMKIPSQAIQSNVTANISTATAIEKISPESLPAAGIQGENMTTPSP